jgi:hypothetical protein
MKIIVYIKNQTYNPIINKKIYKVLLDKNLFINYFKILNFLNYILIFKKINKGIFINYILFNRQIINSKNIKIKKDFNYKDNYLKELPQNNYSNLLEYS